jgi:diaminopimelate epimerase
MALAPQVDDRSTVKRTEAALGIGAAIQQLEGAVIYKMTGSGNDFVFVDGRIDRADSWTPEHIRAVCARGTGVGADGFVVLEPGSASGAVRFSFFNADGDRSQMCGNAALCSIRLSAWLELADPDRMVVETDAGSFPGRCIDGEHERAEIELPSASPQLSPEIPLAPGEQTMRLTSVGVPHLVVLVDDVASVLVEARGRELRHHAQLGPEGANVNFLGNGGSTWAMRTYERGVEGETLACGTGAVACAATLASTRHASLPLELHTSSGLRLTVSGTQGRDGSLTRPCLVGQARLVYRAVIGGANRCAL